MGDETSAFPGIRSGVAMATTTATVTAATTVNTTSTDAKKDDGIVHDNKENANPSSPPAAPTSTPKNGIAWKDLLSDHHNSSHNANGSNDGVTAVGGTLDALHGPNGVRDHIATVSPEDRVLWDSRMDAVWAATTPAQNASRRRAAGGRKRVRSSSPTSSPSYNNGTDGDGAGAAVNVQGTTALQTPKADPALELWDRFSTVGPGAGTGADVLATPTKRGGGVPGRLLSTLMSASSPRPAAKMGLTAGTASQQRAEGLDRGSGLILRRAISCGAQWPKRRRLIGGGDGGQVVAMAGVEGDSPSSAAVKDSMVKALLQTVNGEIEMRGAAAVARPDMKDVSVSVAAAREGQQPPAPRLDERWPGEAPLLERYAVTDSDQGLPDVQMVDPGRPPQTGAPGPSGPPGPQPVTSDGTLVGQDSDDYGDLDLDDEALLELDASIDMGMVMDHDGTVVAKKAPPPVVKATAAPAAKPALSEDEFEDIDDDVFAAAEHLIAEMDTQATRAPDPAGRQGPHVEGDGDAYGDDFGDDFDFEAAEKAATQTAGHPGPSSLAAVCIRR